MSDLLIVWDARFNNARLEQFISELSAELARYSLSFRMVAISNRHAPAEDLIKPSMRAVLDLLHEEAPFHLITLGSRANALATLLSPTLRCELHTNRLPSWLEGETKDSPMVKLSNWLNKDNNWGEEIDVENLYYAPKQLEPNAEVLYFSDDQHAALIQSQLQAEGIYGHAISKEALLNNHASKLKQGGLLIASANMVEQGRLIEYANAFGIPVLLISPDQRYFGIREGENGWVVESPQHPQYYNYLHNWCSMSQDARNMVSYYSRMTQSQQSGLKRYCASLGYPERLEFQDFKIRG